jgi:large subunit ribosomal protein L18
MQEKQQKRLKRHKRIRAKIYGTKEKPRLCIFRSLNHIYAQLIDDEKGKVVISASDREIKKTTGKKKTETAKEVGKLVAQKALSKKIEKVVFDRGGYLYHGRVKAVAEGAREGGLKF